MSQRGVEPNAIGSMVPPFGGGSSNSSGGGGAGVVSPALWNANGLLSGHFAQAASFDGLPVAAVSLAGDGPFDGQRVVARPGTILNMHAIQRVPNTDPANTQVEVYRIRAGTVTSLGVISGAMAANFASATQAPVAPTLQVGDILFVSFAVQSVDPTGADLTVYLELA